jgi:lipopolysaccharide export system protein LptA
MNLGRPMVPPRAAAFIGYFLLLSALFSGGISPMWAETFRFSGNSMTSVLAEGRERTTLVGDAVIISDTTTIKANVIELYGKDSRYARCKGDVTVRDEEKGYLLRCEDLYFDRETDVSRIEGYAEMEDYRNELVVKGEYLEHNGEKDITIIQVGVRILKEDLACRSEFARVKRKENILELSGMPYVYWKGDEYRASRITVNLDTDELSLEGEVQGTVVTEESPSEEGALEEGTSEGEEASEEGSDNGGDRGEDSSGDSGDGGRESDE